MKYLLLPLLLLDCAINWLLKGSFNETLSARADRIREKRQPVWGWTADAIDFLFFWTDDHCHQQRLREEKFGGTWKAWAAA